MPVEAIGVIMSELHEIWQVEGKRHSNPESWYHECHQNFGKFLHYGLKNSVFVIYSNICFSLITFSLKIRITSCLFWDDP